MSKRKYHITITKEWYIELLVDESLMPDDKWRDEYYDADTLDDIAGYIAHNICQHGKKDYVSGIGMPSNKTFIVEDFEDGVVTKEVNEFIGFIE